MNWLLRVTIVMICVITFLNALVFVGISVYKSVHGYVLIFQGKVEERPGIQLVESLDGFLLAIVFLIFAIGFGKLFIPEQRIFQKIQISWLEPKSFSDLKKILWESILTTLVVIFAISIVQNLDHLEWNILIIPASILLLSGGFYLLKKAH